RLAGIGRLLGLAVAAERREELAQLPQRCRSERGPEPVEVLLVEVVSDRLDERQIGKGDLRVGCTAGDNRATVHPGLPGELTREARLADAGLAGEDYEAALPTARCEQRVLQDAELVIAPDQDRAEGGARHPGIFSAGAPGSGDQGRSPGPQATPSPFPS